jgi:hypothetical protein
MSAVMMLRVFMVMIRWNSQVARLNDIGVLKWVLLVSITAARAHDNGAAHRGWA